jgi:hypothetical protein
VNTERLQRSVAEQLMLDAVAGFSRARCPSRGALARLNELVGHAAHKKHGARCVGARSSGQSSGKMIVRDFSPLHRDRAIELRGARASLRQVLVVSACSARPRPCQCMFDLFERHTHGVGCAHPVHTKVAAVVSNRCVPHASSHAHMHLHIHAAKLKPTPRRTVLARAWPRTQQTPRAASASLLRLSRIQ